MNGHGSSIMAEHSTTDQGIKQGILKGDCTIDLLFDWFGISCMTTNNFCFYLQNKLMQTSQTGGQLYNDTSPISFPWKMGSNQASRQEKNGGKIIKKVLSTNYLMYKTIEGF